MNVVLVNNLNNAHHIDVISDITNIPINAAPELPGVDWAVIISGGSRLKNKIAYWRNQGVKVAVYWVGTDVLLACSELSFRESLPEVDLNLTVHQRLADELSFVGIKAQSIGSFSVQKVLESPQPPEKPTVSLYLPSDYGMTPGYLVKELIALCPEVEFLIYGNKARHPISAKNVQQLGWLDNEYKVLDVLRRSHVNLRWTTHDGFPRSVIEAKMMGRHAITSYPYEGCLYAPYDEDIVPLLKDSNTYTLDTSDWPQWYREHCAPEAFKKRLLEALDESK